MRHTAVLGVGFAALFALVGATCHGEGDKQVLHQTREAGSFVRQHPGSPPPVKQAGQDVEQNAVVLQGSVGTPAAPQPYSPAASAAARRQAEEEQAKPPEWLSWLGQALMPIAPWAAPVLAGAWGLIEMLRRRRAAARLVAVYQGVEEIKAGVGGGQYADAITGVLRTVAGAHNVYKDVKAELAGLRRRGIVTDGNGGNGAPPAAPPAPTPGPAPTP